jgi:ribose 5-phosphate isomerase A
MNSPQACRQRIDAAWPCHGGMIAFACAGSLKGLRAKIREGSACLQGQRMSNDDWKRQAAEHAMRYVRDGMRIGLGTGSTAAKFVDLLGVRVREGLKVVCVPTSEATRLQAAALNIPLASLDDHPSLDLTVDGADEIDDELRLIKGGGGALLREKIVAVASESVVIIADSSTRVETLGRFHLPLEVVPFGISATRRLVTTLASDCGCEGAVTVRAGESGAAFVTDNGNHILDCAFGVIDDPEALDDALKLIPGVVESGLFLGIADIGIVAGPKGIEVLSKIEDDFDQEI